jgi:HAL2 family 3'(2'),5'-bisphosphate nucleotidase
VERRQRRDSVRQAAGFAARGLRRGVCARLKPRAPARGAATRSATRVAKPAGAAAPGESRLPERARVARGAAAAAACAPPAARPLTPRAAAAAQRVRAPRTPLTASTAEPRHSRCILGGRRAGGVASSARRAPPTHPPSPLLLACACVDNAAAAARAPPTPPAMLALHPRGAAAPGAAAARACRAAGVAAAPRAVAPPPAAAALARAAVTPRAPRRRAVAAPARRVLRATTVTAAASPAGAALLASGYAAELEAAASAVRLAAKLCAAAQRTLVLEGGSDSASKADDSPVTVCDYAAQALISASLEAAFPNIALLAEEDAAALRAPRAGPLLTRVTELVNAARALERLPALSGAQVVAAIDRGASRGGPTGRHWVLDPIDGTKGFMRGRHYTVALALVEDGAVVLGVMGCPNLAASGVAVAPRGVRSPVGTLFAAARGGGAVTLPLQCSSLAEDAVAMSLDGSRSAAEARYVESWNDSACAAHGDCAAVAAALGAAAPPLRLDSCAKYGVCARGEAELYLRFPPDNYGREKVWDHAAGVIVFTEAGGVVTDGAGAPLDFSAGRYLDLATGIVAAPAHLHAALLDAVASAVKRTPQNFGPQ